MSSPIAGIVPSASDISGLAVTVTISGNQVFISGQPVTVSGNQVFISGQPVSVSGNAVGVSGQAVLISGQTVVASVTTNISGQTVYLASGFNPVQLYGLDQSGVQLMPLIVNASGSNILRVDAGSISANVSGNAVRISGETVYLVSGQNNVQISGQLVVVSGIVGANVSGNVVYTISGQNPVFNYGFIDASGEWTQLRMTQSGQGISGIPHKLVVTFSGESIIGSVSGNAVAVSGQAVLVSGQLVAVSGLVATSVSGNMVSVSGQPVNASGNTVYTASGQNEVKLMGLDLSGNQLLPLRLSESGRNTLVVNIASNTNNSNTYAAVGSINTDLLNLNNAMRTQAIIAGYDPIVDAGVRIRVTASGQGISGVTNKLIVDFSGSVAKTQTPVQIRTRDTLLIDGASGGIALLSGDVLRVTVRNIGVSGTVMYVGGSGDYPWVASGQTYPAFSGHGFWLRDGDGVTIMTSNMAFVRVVSHTSGQRVSYLGEQY